MIHHRILLIMMITMNDHHSANYDGDHIDDHKGENHQDDNHQVDDAMIDHHNDDDDNDDDDHLSLAVQLFHSHSHRLEVASALQPFHLIKIK